MAGGKIGSGVMEQGGARYPGWMNNIGIVNATTTNAADSIKITGSDGTALSVSNYGWITLPSATTGRLVTLSMTADVTILLTGAHWGFGTKGDLTDYILYVYAINDAGTLKWGIGAKPNRLIVLNADDVDDSAPTSVNAYEKVMVNTALGSDSDARVVGWFKANFDDTGGAAEDLWAVQSGDGDINIGSIGVEAIPMVAGYMQNIGLASATTTNAADSIKITSADGQALSTTNLGWIVLPGATSGQLQVMPVSADITLDITGCHWGAGTKGDLVDAVLHVYAINDAQILKWGVAQLSNLVVALGADDQTTATNVTTSVGVFVNSALSGDSNCCAIGWFKASFDDSGGAAEDLWAVQTGVGDIGLGPRGLVPSMIHLNTGAGHGSGSTTIRRIETSVSSVGAGVTVAHSASLGTVFTVNEHGSYAIAYRDADASANEGIGVSLNSAQLTTAIGGATGSTIIAYEHTGGANFVGSAAVQYIFNIGDRIRPHTSGNPDATSAVETTFIITKGA